MHAENDNGEQPISLATFKLWLTFLCEREADEVYLADEPWAFSKEEREQADYLLRLGQRAFCEGTAEGANWGDAMDQLHGMKETE